MLIGVFGRDAEALSAVLADITCRPAAKPSM
jgi:hypothetical protein